MPTQKNQTRYLPQARRRFLLLVLLLPTGGCSYSLASLKPRPPLATIVSVDPAAIESVDPATIESVDPAAEEKGKVAANDTTSATHTVAFWTQSLVDSESPVDLVDGIIDLAEESDDLSSTLPVPVLVAEFPTVSWIDVLSDSPAAPQVIDLASALGMAGGSAWTVQLARERTVEAHADLQEAQALWLPSLQFGVGWNTHAGRIQATDGSVIEASRSSLFVGGGATLGSGPIAGGSGGPFRLFADLALAEAFFAPKIAGRQLSARRAGVSVAKNRALLDAGIAYVDLLESSGQVADAQAAIDSAGELLNLTRTFADAGAGAQADVDRAATEEARLDQRSQNANRLFRTRSAKLSRHLRLDPRFPLQPADQVIVPIELSSDGMDVDAHLEIALAQRPEINELSHEIAALCLAVRKANVEPWIPYVSVTTSGGSFGGGPGSNLDNQAGRSDIDLQALWELDSLGLGVAAKRNRAGSQLAQRRMSLADLRDQITEEVVAAYEDVANYRTQIESANRGMVLAEASYQRNLQRVRAGEGLPIELLQAITARADALRDRTAAVSDFNRSQLRLLYASGRLRP